MSRLSFELTIISNRKVDVYRDSTDEKDPFEVKYPSIWSSSVGFQERVRNRFNEDEILLRRKKSV